MQDTSLLQIIGLAATQGITEFIPVSSSAHLLLFSKLFGYNDHGLNIDVAAHTGSLIAVLIYFRHKLFALCADVIATLHTRKVNEGSQFVGFLIVATLPLIPAGFALSGFASGLAENSLRSPIVIAFSTIIFALVLWYAESYGQSVVKFNPLSWKFALFIGAMQCLALVPGTSRAGIVVTACLFGGMRRKQSLEVAMLLSIPAIIAATVLMFFRVVVDQQLVFGVGTVVAVVASALCAYVVIYGLMRFINVIGFYPFILYRLVLGAVLLWIFKENMIALG